MASTVMHWPTTLRFHSQPLAKDWDSPNSDSEPADRARWVLALGIVSLLLCPLGIFAWMAGNACLTDIAEGRLDPICESNARAGRLLGKIAICMLVIKVTVIFPVAVAIWMV